MIRVWYMRGMRGMTFIDVVIGTSIMLVVFLSIFAAYQLAIELVMNTKARVGGLAIVSERMEYIRGLPYESLGTVGGIPSGAIAQTSTTTMNNVPYTIRTLIKYVDDPADGSGSGDTNSITADYKEIKIEAVWTLRGRARSTFAVTRVAPHGIESLTSGGTLRVNVFDANAQPIQGASVRITNASTTPTVDLTLSTDSTGSVALPGTPPAANYKISVTKTNFSSGQTYDITNQNPNPNPGHVSVANQQTTTASFAIDAVSSLTVRTVSPIDVGAFTDTFTTDAGLSATTTSVVSGGALELFSDDSGYSLVGEARSDDVAPALLVSWDTLSWTPVTPAGTTLRVQVVYPNGGVYSLVPDGVITGNSAGLTSGSVSLSAVPTSTYPTLALTALLDTTDASSTPALSDWQIDYHAGPSPLPNVGLSYYGTKTIGTSISGAPIYKVVQNITTDSAGTVPINALEWDSYTFGVTGSTYSISELCPSPVSVAPNTSGTLVVTLVPRTANTLRVEVTGSGAPLSDATVTLTAPGNETQTTSACGQAFFDALSVSTYTLTVSKSGYQDNVQQVSVGGATVVTVPLVP